MFKLTGYRSVFFSFKYEDVTRAMVVRNSWVTQGKQAAGFIDAADFEKVKRQGDQAIKNWIDQQLEGTSVTVVLVGAKTCTSRWVKYEIEQSIKRGNGLIGVDISQIRDLKGNTSNRCGEIPKGKDFYLWNKHQGYQNLGNWIEKAAKAAGK
ncbi:TIR domain-containing protein [Vibrio splendidus]